jgi:hypothetical protein
MHQRFLRNNSQYACLLTGVLVLLVSQRNNALSSEQNHLAQSVRLSRMQSELQESETKLVEMLLILPAQSDEVPKQVVGSPTTLLLHT